MTAISVMFPGGKFDPVTQNVSYDDREKIFLYNNMGDFFVYDSSLRILQSDQLIELRISTYDQRVIDEINSTCDYVFLRGSNYFNEHMDWPEATLRVLRSIKVPVIPFGVGSQMPDRRMPKFSPETEKILRVMADSCESVGVRGETTAEVFDHYGVRNTEIIGCPTAFRHLKPRLSIHLRKPERVLFTLRREVNAAYSNDVDRYLEIHRQTLKRLKQTTDLSILCQGEVDEKILYHRLGDPHYQEAFQRLNEGFFQNDKDLIELYQNNLLFFEDVAGYEACVRDFDWVVGFRLHGNLLALANGIPSIYFVYDSRTREFAETFQIPAFDIDEGGEFDLGAYRDPDLFRPFEKAYAEIYRRLVDFLEKNRMSHRLERETRGIDRDNNGISVGDREIESSITVDESSEPGRRATSTCPPERLDASRRILCRPTSFLINDWEAGAGRCRMTGWFLCGYESPECYRFRVNGRAPEIESLGLSSPALAKVFPFSKGASRSGFVLEEDIQDRDRQRGFLEVALCERLFGEPENQWHTAFLPLGPAGPLPNADQLERTQGNKSEGRYLAYGYTTAKRIERILATYFRISIEEVGPLLDWGVGCGRVIRHLSSRNPNSMGTDIDADNIRWCRENLEGNYTVNGLWPPLRFSDGFFGLIYGISVFSHLSYEAGVAWRDELHRLLRPGGIAIVTTHGTTGMGRILDDAKLLKLASSGFDASLSDPRLREQIGDQEYYRATYQSAARQREFFEERFTVVDQIRGANALTQDFVVLLKEHSE